MAGDDNGRITVSRDALRAELAQMELRLIEKLATKAEVETLERRVSALELANSPTEKEFDVVRTWQARLAGALALVATVAMAALPLVIEHYAR